MNNSSKECPDNETAVYFNSTDETHSTTNPQTESISELPAHHRISYLPLDKTYCENHASELETVLQELNDLFAPVGATIIVTDSVLSIDVNEEKYTSATTRRAGRKSKSLDKRMEEIMAYRETHTAMETAEWMGLTKQTYYRRMKELRENDSIT